MDRRALARPILAAREQITRERDAQESASAYVGASLARRAGFSLRPETYEGALVRTSAPSICD